MKNLFIVRHAKSDWSQLGLRDHDRVLSARGNHDAPLMAQLLQQILTKKNVDFLTDLQLVSSSAVRARTTAGFFATAFAVDLDIESELYDADMYAIFQVIKYLDNAKNTAFLFGHNPTLTHFVNRFAEHRIDNLPTCGVAHLQTTATEWDDLSIENTHLVETWFPKLVLAAYR